MTLPLKKLQTLWETLGAIQREEFTLFDTPCPEEQPKDPLSIFPSVSTLHPFLGYLLQQFLLMWQDKSLKPHPDIQTPPQPFDESLCFNASVYPQKGKTVMPETLALGKKSSNPLFPQETYAGRIDQKVSLSHHLHMLRRLLWVATLATVCTFGIGLYVSNTLLAWLVSPLASCAPAHVFLIYTNLPEAFMAHIRCAGWIALCGVCIFFTLALGIFMWPAMEKVQKRYAFFVLSAAPLLTMTGIWFSYRYVCPWVWRFFLSYHGSTIYGIPVHIQPRLGEYVHLTITLVGSFGIAFLFPLLMITLSLLLRIQPSVFIKARKSFVVLLALASALITPPDWLSPLCMFFPLWMLYESAIIALKFMWKRELQSPKDPFIYYPPPS